MSETSFDVAIVGGGLAGSSAALVLAEAGYRVGLFEAKHYPHHKVCGEFLSSECIHLFNQLGVTSQIQALCPISIRTVQITAPNGTTWTNPLPGEAWGLSRYALDKLLVDHARPHGVAVYENSTVTNVSGRLSEKFCLEIRSASHLSTFQARAVIAAHGKRSNLDRALNRSFLDKPQPFMALKNHFHGPPLGDQVRLFVFPGGYCGMSEVEGGLANVCLLVRQEVFRQAGGTIEQFIAWMCQQNPPLGQWLSQAIPVHDRWLSIGQVPFIRKRLVENDILMAGDAAGLITPLAGDGMVMALHGGMLAATYVDKMLRQPTLAKSLLKDYAQDWRRQFANQMRLARGLQSIMLRPSLLTPGLYFLNRFPVTGELLVRYTRDSHVLKQKRVSP
ncbi:MAG: NAD(P)/FAD-dependent oxidoreductase [Anaerolineae bacterium]|nr:NAD(P)/FAD-dependent oxidoreductase [Anaerolineae bacterium]